MSLLDKLKESDQGEEGLLKEYIIEIVREWLTEKRDNIAWISSLSEARYPKIAKQVIEDLLKGLE
jgi:hypothetical protein